MKQLILPILAVALTISAKAWTPQQIQKFKAAGLYYNRKDDSWNSEPNSPTWNELQQRRQHRFIYAYPTPNEMLCLIDQNGVPHYHHVILFRYDPITRHSWKQIDSGHWIQMR